MKKSLAIAPVSQVASNENIPWENLGHRVRPLVQRLVWRSSVWPGQEEDVVDDIVQDALLHLYRHLLRAGNGEVPPVEHPERMIPVIARRCFLDKWRKDRRLIRLDPYDSLSIEHVVQLTAINPENEAVDVVYQVWVFVKIADFVKTKIPDKQRIALLRDLAQRMHFGASPTALQKVFADRGMDFRPYAGRKSRDKRESGKQAANLSLSLTRLRELGKDFTL